MVNKIWKTEIRVCKICKDNYLPLYHNQTVCSKKCRRINFKLIKNKIKETQLKKRENGKRKD